MPVTRRRYQNGSLIEVERATGPNVWVYRWREIDEEGRRVQRKQVIGTKETYKTKALALKAVDFLRLKANADVPLTRPDEPYTFAKLWAISKSTNCTAPTRIAAPRRSTSISTMPGYI